MEKEKLICPFCGGEIHIVPCDEEGNLHEEPGYEENPRSGLGYRLRHIHEENMECPISSAGEDGGTIGVWIYNTQESAAEACGMRRRTNMEKLLLEDKHEQVMRLLLHSEIVCPTCPAKEYCGKQQGEVCCREVLEKWGKDLA